MLAFNLNYDNTEGYFKNVKMIKIQAEITKF